MDSGDMLPVLERFAPLPKKRPVAKAKPVHYTPGNPEGASAMDILAHAIVQLDSGVPGWESRVLRMKQLIAEAFPPGDVSRIIRGAEALADMQRGVKSRHYTKDEEIFDPILEDR